MTIHVYCQGIKIIIDLLANFDQSMSEKTLFTYMVNGLSEKFDQLIGIVCHQDPLLSFLKARSMLVVKNFVSHRFNHSMEFIETMLQPQLSFILALRTLLVLLSMRPMVYVRIRTASSKMNVRIMIDDSKVVIDRV